MEKLTRNQRQEIASLLQTVYHCGMAGMGDRDSASWEHGQADATIAIKLHYIKRARAALASEQLAPYMTHYRLTALPRTHALCNLHGKELMAVAEAIAASLDIDANQGLIFGHPDGSWEAPAKASATPAAAKPATSEHETGFVAGYEACAAGALSEYAARKGGELRRFTPARVWVAVEPARAEYARGYIEGFMAAESARH